MAVKYCNLCDRNIEGKRKIGIGTFLLVIITCGFWILAIPFYPKRCPICSNPNLSKPQPKKSRE